MKTLSKFWLNILTKFRVKDMYYVYHYFRTKMLLGILTYVFFYFIRSGNGEYSRERWRSCCLYYIYVRLVRSGLVGKGDTVRQVREWLKSGTIFQGKGRGCGGGSLFQE